MKALNQFLDDSKKDQEYSYLIAGVGCKKEINGTKIPFNDQRDMEGTF